MEQRGAVYLHKKMAFSDGGISEKYLILLNPRSQNDPYLFVKTTSQQEDKPLRETSSQNTETYCALVRIMASKS